MRSDLVGGRLGGSSSGHSGRNGQAEEGPAGDSCSQAKAGVAVGTQSGGCARGRLLKRETLWPVDLLPGKGGAGLGKGVKLKPIGKPSGLYISLGFQSRFLGRSFYFELPWK